MTLTQLQYFCCAARYHSATKAASELYVTQPAVSLAIRQLEKEFHLTLFSRDEHRLELTAEGEAFYTEASRLLQYSDELRSRFTLIGHGKPSLKVGIPPMLSIIFFPELLNAFGAAHPNINIELDEYASLRACELVQSELLDIALANMELYNIDTFESELLYTDRLVFCVAPSHKRATQSILELSELDGEEILLFNTDSVQIQVLTDRFQRLGIHPRIVMRSSQLYTTLKFLEERSCGCFLFESMLRQLPGVVGIPVSAPIEISIGMVWKKGRYVSRELSAFIDFVRGYATGGMPDDT